MYKMVILTKDGACPFWVKPIGFQAWHSIFGARGTGIFKSLNDLNTLKKVCDLMLDTKFYPLFYEICNANRKLADDLVELLKLVLYAVHYEEYEDEEHLKRPLPLFLEGYINNEGDYVKYDYIDDSKWNYEHIMKTDYTRNKIEEKKKKKNLKDRIAELKEAVDEIGKVLIKESKNEVESSLDS